MFNCVQFETFNFLPFRLSFCSFWLNRDLNRFLLVALFFPPQCYFSSSSSPAAFQRDAEGVWKVRTSGEKHRTATKMSTCDSKKKRSISFHGIQCN